MNDFLSSFFNKLSKKVSRRKTTKWNKNQIKLDLLKLEERLVPAPNLVVPTTTSGAPLGFVAGTNLAFSGALDIELLDTPTPTSTGNFNTTVAASAGTASATASGAATVTGSGTNSLSISGSLADVNATLNSLTYTNSTTGAASLVVTARDSAGTPLTDTKTIYVNAANATAAPTITTALADVRYYAETTATTEAAISFTVSDPQGSAGVTVTGTSNNPNLILSSDITIAGTYPNLTVTLKHQANVTGTALITLKVSDNTNFTTKSFNVNVTPVAQYYWDVLAGNGTAGITDGTGTAATFNAPWQIAVDTVNNLYVADYNSGTIRKITPAGVVTTIAGSSATGYLDNANPLLAKFNKPLGVAVDNNGNVYVSEYGGYIRKIAYSNGTYGPVTTLASSLGSSTTLWGMLVVTPDGSTVYANRATDKKIYKIDTATNTGAALTTSFTNVPMGLSFDNSGNLLVREMTSGFTFKVTPAGVVTTLITAVQYGNAQAIQLADGTYLSAAQRTISRISPPTQSVVVVGGGGSAGALGLGAAAGFADIRSIADGPNGFIYVSDFATTENKIRVGKPAPSLLNPGTQSTLEGTRLAFSSANLAQLGALANASDSSNVKLALTYKLSVQNGTLDFNNVAVPNGMTVTFSADRRSVTLTGSEAAINTYMLNFGYTPDANYINANMSGGALASGAASPDVLSLTVTTVNNLTNPITGSLNLLVKATDNKPRILTALPDVVYYTNNSIITENAIDFTIADADTTSNLFTSNNKAIANGYGYISATSDNPNLILPADIDLAIGGTTNARTITFKHQPNITGVANITITIADAQGNQNTYTFKVTVKTGPSYYWGTLTNTAGSSQITYDSNGDLIAIDYVNGAVRRITPQGVSTLLKSGFTNPAGVAIDANKNLYVSDGDNSIKKVPYNSSNNTYGTTTILAANAQTGEILISPDGTTLYGGKFYQIVKINIATGAVSVLAGSGVSGSADGVGLNASFSYARYLAWDNNGNILAAEANSNVRQITLAGVVTTLPLFANASSLSPHQNTIVQTRDGNYVGMVQTPKIRVSTPDGLSIAVSGGTGYLNGLNLEATFTSQRGGVATPDGKVYISDSGVIRVGTLYPSLLNPGAQSTLEGTRLAFSSANLQQLGAFANDTDQNLVRLPITYTLSAQFGKLDFNNVAVPAGVTVTFSADRKSVTLSGLEAAINTYMLNLGYTPDANYINANMSGGALASGAIAPDVLSFSVVTANNINNPVTGSLNLLVKAADPKPKIITALPDRQYYVENATATETALSFTIADADTATFTNNASTGARITVTSDNPNLILPADMATAIGGSGANRTFTVKHQANITGVANVTITINDGTNQNTYTFKVTVVPTPQYYWNILAGSPTAVAGTTNATGTSASFSGPSGLVKDSSGNYFVADTTNNLIRKITPLGEVTTFAGAGGVGAFLDGAGTAAKFNSPQGLAIDSANNLYVADFGNNRIRKIDSAGNVTTIAGTGTASSLDGAALSATMRGPTGIAVDSTGIVYWTDKTTSIIRKLQGGQVTTIAGSSGLTGTTDGTGSVARFNLPTFLTINNAGNLVVNDATNLSYRQVTPAGVVTTLFNYTSGATAVGVDAQGNIYAGLSSNTLSLISSFDTTTIMGTGTAGSAIAVNTAATVGSTRQMVFLSDGTIVIADNTRNNIRVGTPIPSLMNPGKQIVLADQLLTFDNAALEGLGIQSNGYPEPLSITLTVTKGVFSLSQTTGLTFTTGDGTNDTTMTFTGTMANINAALTGLVYNFDEVTYPSITADTLTISTPYTVGGVTSTISQVVPIQIVKPPVITAVADKLVNLGTAIPAATFTVTDADTAANALTYTITSSNTALVANSGLVRTGGTGATGTTVPANAANSLAITAVAGRTGTTTITISVFDGIITTTTSFLVIVSPIVGAPDLLATSDTGTSSTDNLTSDTTPTFAVSIGAGSGIQVGDVVAIYNGTTKIGEAVVTNADILAGSIQVTTSALADGNYSNITSSVIFGTTRGAISSTLSPALVIDTTAPSANGLPDLNPASDTGASSTDNVTNDTTPTFSIPLTGTGAVAGDVIQLYNGSTLIGTYTLTAGDITANGASLTTSTLPAGTYSDIKYRFVDTAGNTSAYSGSMSPALVIDLSAPTLVTLSPADNATNLVPPTTLVMTFNENMAKGITGTIVIKKTSDNTTVESFNVATSGRVMVSNSTVTITPSVTLAYGTGYYVTVANTALLDLAGNAYAGLSNTTDWNFTTLSSPPSPTGVDLVSASDSGSSSTDNKTNKTDITLEVALASGSQVGDVIKLYDGTTVVGTVTLTANDITAGKVSFNLVSQTDGTHSYKATLSNNAGESAPTSVLSTIIDTSLPGAPTITPIVSPSSSTTPTLTGTAEAGATVTVVIDGTSVTVIADGSGNWSYPIPAALAEGSHTVVVTQTDVAGNIGIASSTISFVVDTTAPIATTFSPADGSTVSKPSVLSITFNEAIALGSSGTITIFNDSNTTSQVISLPNANITVSGNTLTIVPTTALIAGTNYHVEISSGAIKDLAGNAYAGISNSTDWNFTTNNAPSSPSGVDLQSVSDSGTSNSDNKTNATALNFDVPIPAGASVGDVIKLYDGTTEVGSITIIDSTMLNAGTVTFNLTGVTSGSHSYTSTLTNTGSGLTSSPSPALVVDVNNTLPSAPVITALAPTKNQTPTISGTAPANSTVTLTIGTGTPVTVTTDANGNWNYTPTTPLAQGTYVLSATATDLYGNISLVSAPTNLVIDTTAPTKPIITGIGLDNGVSSTDKITSANVLTIAGTAEANSIITIYDNGIKIGTAITGANGVWTFPTPTLADGSNRFSANATDAAGNKSVNADSYTMVVDTSAPTAPVINSLPSPNGDNTPTISGTGEPGAVVTINANGSPIGTAVVDANGNWTFTPTTPISDGTTAFTAIQKDTAGNTSPTSNTVTTVIDTTAPNAPSINDLGTINSTTPAITGTAEPDSTIKLYDGTTLIGTATADSNGNWTITPSPALNEGTNNLIATATDPSGNISPTSSPVVVVVDTVAPIATSFSPATGSATSSIFENLVINFSEAVALGSSGTIELRDSNGVLIESFSISSNRLTLSGNSLTIDPTANLTLGTGYYVTMTAGTIKDLAGNAFAGLTNNSDWAFTTSSLAIPPAPSGVNLQPGSDTGSSNTDNITSDNTPTFDIVLNPSGLNVGDVVHLYDNGVEVGSVILTAADIAAGKVSITSSTLADGVHSLTSKIEDAIGTFSAASPALSVSIITQPPARAGTPDLAASSDTGSSSTDNITAIKTPTFNGTGTPGETVSLFVDGVLAGVGVVDSNGNYSITASSPIADGVHAITTQNTNIAGISGAVSLPLSLTVDSTPPATPTTPADLTSVTDTGRSNTDNLTSDTTPDFSGSGLTPGNTVVLYVDGQPAGTAVVAANGTWTVTVSPALSDGSHTVTYLVNDLAGNASGFAPTMNITVDTVVPAKPSVPTLDPASDTGLSATDGITRDNTPTINGTGGTPGFDVILKDGNGITIGIAIVAADGTWSITPTTPLGDGTYNFTATYTSISGVVGTASDPIRVVIDTVAPSAPAAPTISLINPSATAGHTNSTTPVFEGSGLTPGNLVELFDGNTKVGSAIVDANGNYQIISSSLADGAHSFTVKVTDAAGNTSGASSPTSLTIDSRVPGSPTTPDLTAATDTGTSNTDNITSDNTPDFQGVVDSNSTAQVGDFVEIYSGNTLVGVGVVVLNNGVLEWSVTVGSIAAGYIAGTLGATSLANGTQAISAKFRTPGGTVSASSQALTVVVDTIAPAAPSGTPSGAPDLAASSDTGNSSTDELTNDTTPTFTGTGGVPGDTVNLYAGSTLVGTAIVAPDGSYSVTPTSPLADGTYDFKTNFVDPAGNTSGFSPSLLGVVIDSTPPAVPPTPDLIATADTGASNFDNLTSENRPTFEGFGTTGDTIKIYVDGVLAGTTIVDANGNWSITTNSIADGVHQITSQAIDPAGNASAQSTPLVLTIDSSAPNSPIFTTTSGPTSNAQPPISGTGEPGSTITLYDGTTPIGTAIVNANGSWNITPSSPLAEGTHNFTTTATDGAGNISLPSSPIAVTIDTSKPLPPVIASVSQDTGNPSDKITSDNTLTITGNAEPGSIIKVYDSSSGSPVQVGTVIVGPDGTYSVTTSTLSNGSHPLSITSTDSAGNISQPVAVGTYTIDSATPTAPTFGSVSQDTGANTTDKITSDNTLTIAGLAGSAEPGTTITVYDSSSGSPVAVGTVIVAGDGSYLVTTSVLSDGNHPLTITSTDTAGNQSSPTSLGTWSIDTAAPNAPSFGSVSQDTGISATDKITSDTILTISGAAGSAEPGTTITVYDTSSGTPVAVGTAIVAANGSYSVTTSVLSDGNHPLSITATDVAGNQSSPTSLGIWTIDTAAPTSPVVTSVSDDTGRSNSDKITSDNTLTVTGTAEPNSLVTIYAYIDNSDPNIPDTIRVVVGTGYADANGNYAVTTNPLADNALNEKYVLSVTATDPAGMESPATSIGAWAISTSIPNPPVVTSVSQDTGSSSTDKLTNDTTLTVTGTGTPGTTITIYDGITPVGTGLVDANGNYSVTTSALADGAHALSASATNPFGFEGLSTQLGTWTVDTVDPIQPTLTANNGLPLVSGLANSAEPGSTVSVVIGGATYTTIVDGTGAWSINLATAIPTSGSAPALATGTFPISVFSTDAAGNSTTPVVSNLVVTTIGQPAPSITSNPSTSDTTPLISGNSEIGSTVTVTLLDANNVVIATYSNVPTNSNGTWALDLQTAIPDGGTTPIPALVNGNSYNLSATATDANNQFTSVPVTQKLVIDTTAPNTPVITSPAITNDTTPLFTGTAEPGTVIELTINRANGTSITIYQTVTSPTAPGNWSIDFSQISPSAGFLNDLADGNYIVEVVAIDAAFNRSTAAVQNPFIVDTVAPAAPVITSPSLTNDNTPVLTGTAEPGSTVTVVIDGLTYITTAASPSGAWSVNLQTAVPVGGSTPITALTDGIHTVTVTATDAAGNTSAPTTQNLRVDTTPPAIPQITSSDKNNDTTPVITGLAEPGSTVAVTINGATFSTIVGPNGSWSVDLGTAIPNGGTTPIAPLVAGNSYPISVTATDAAGNTSVPATQNLAIDTSAPISPTITSPALTNQVPPTVTGTAAPNSTVTLTINGATFTTPVDANGNWTVNTATATLISGNRGTYTDGPYPISVYSTNGFNNQSGTSTQTLTVDLTPPVIIGALASFGGNLNLDESNSNAIVSVNISGIEDGRTVTVTLNGLTYTGIVYSGKVDITIPTAILSNLADGSSQTLTVTASDLAGNAATPYQVPFTVDKTGPARPSFVSITSTSTDPNPADPFTGVVNPTVVISGQAGQTIVIHGPNGIVDPSNYTVVDNNGLYTITFTTNQTSGNYQVNLQDVNGNENANGPGAQNFFTIDSIPVLYDMPNKRSTAQGSTFGNLGVKNTLNGQTFNVPQQADNTWIDLDGETLTFGLSGSTVVERDSFNNPTMIEASINGASLKLDPRTGAYIYTPVSNTDRLDTFVVTIRDTSGNQTQLKLMFNSRDTLDRDGIVSISESVLAGLVNQSGNATNLLGDLNQDGTPDSQQNSVSTLAWRKEADFQIATDSNTAANTDPTAIICIVVNATAFDPATTTTLTQLMGNVDPLAQILQVSVSGLSSVAADESKYFKPWDIMNFSVESLVSTGLNDVNATRDGTQIQVSIDISKANIPMGGSGFSLYRKFVSANIISDYADAGITLTDLDGNIITTAGWFDYTQRTPGGDGAIGKDFNNDGKIDAIIITLTDNAFGDDSPIANTVVDPITPTGNFPTPPGGSNPAVPTPPGSNPPAPAPTSFATSGTSTGSVPGTTVNIYPTSSVTPSTVLVPFANWQGEVRIVRADINADGNLETIATMGEGGLPILRVFDGVTGAQTMEIQVYDRAFTGGIFVAVGDLGNDGILDFVTGAGQGGGPHVKIFNSITGAETSSFMAYDINFRGGVSVAVGDIDGSGFAAIVTGAGQGGGPHVKVFNGTDHSLIKQFMAYASTFSGGVYVAVGDYLSDGKYEIITGAGAGGGPHIKIWDYETLNLDGQTMAFTDFTKDNGEVIDAIFNGGVRVALADANGDNVLDILAGSGPTGGPRVEVFVGFRLELLMNFFSGDKKDGRGVFVSQ